MIIRKCARERVVHFGPRISLENKPLGYECDQARSGRYRSGNFDVLSEKTSQAISQGSRCQMRAKLSKEIGQRAIGSDWIEAIANQLILCSSSIHADPNV
jgi:hypothetical protein